MEFAGILAVDRLAGEVMRLPVNDERDAFHQSLALANAGGWLNKIATAEFVERERAVLRGGDVKLLALITEYQRLRDKANQGEMSEEERARRCDDFRSVRDKIEKLRPATLRGVLAVLDLETDEDPGWWPKEAIEGLRDIFTMGSQSCAPPIATALPLASIPRWPTASSTTWLLSACGPKALARISPRCQTCPRQPTSLIGMSGFSNNGCPKSPRLWPPFGPLSMLRRRS